jgi:hypothetical protein
MNAPFFGIWDWPEERAEAGGGPSLALSTAVWSDEHLPIPVFFRPDEVARQEPITPADSVLFWTIVEDMEDRLGIDAFRPARKEELAKDSSFTIAGYLLESPRPLTISYAWIPGSNAGDALDA